MAKTNLKAVDKIEDNNQKETEGKMTPEDLYYKLNYARNDIVIELFKMEALIKLGDAVSIGDSDTEESIEWISVFQILEDIKDKAMEKVTNLEGLINEFREMYKKSPGQNIERGIV